MISRRGTYGSLKVSWAAGYVPGSEIPEFTTVGNMTPKVGELCLFQDFICGTWKCIIGHIIFFDCLYNEWASSLPSNTAFSYLSDQNCTEIKNVIPHLKVMVISSLLCLNMLLSCCHVRLFATPWTVTCQAPLSVGSPRQEYWSGLLFPTPENLLDPAYKPTSPA